PRAATPEPSAPRRRPPPTRPQGSAAPAARHRSPPVPGLLREPGEPVERDRLAVVGDELTGPPAEALVDLHRQDARRHLRVLVVVGRQHRVDASADDVAHPPRLGGPIPRVGPLELVVDLVETTVDA